MQQLNRMHEYGIHNLVQHDILCLNRRSNLAYIIRYKLCIYL